MLLRGSQQRTACRAGLTPVWIAHNAVEVEVLEPSQTETEHYRLKRESAVSGPENGKRGVPFSDDTTAKQLYGRRLLLCNECMAHLAKRRLAQPLYPFSPIDRFG